MFFGSFDSLGASVHCRYLEWTIAAGEFTQSLQDGEVTMRLTY
jgi:hypothetical protein